MSHPRGVLADICRRADEKRAIWEALNEAFALGGLPLAQYMAEELLRLTDAEIRRAFDDGVNALCQLEADRIAGFILRLRELEVPETPRNGQPRKEDRFVGWRSPGPGGESPCVILPDKVITVDRAQIAQRLRAHIATKVGSPALRDLPGVP